MQVVLLSASPHQYTVICTRKSCTGERCGRSLFFANSTNLTLGMRKNIWTNQLQFGIRCCGLMKPKFSYLIITRGDMHEGKGTQHSRKPLPAHSRIQRTFQHNVQESATNLKLCHGWIFQPPKTSDHNLLLH